MERRTFLKNSMVTGTAVLGAGSLAFNQVKEAGDQATKDQFRFSIVVGDSDINPALLAPGWDFAEIPNLLVVKPLSPKANWEATKARIKSWSLPPIYAASHFFATFDQPEEGRIPFCGPDADWDLAEFWTIRSFERMSELGIINPGVYGDFFAIPEGYSKTKGTDQCLRFLSMAGDVAKKHKMNLVIEPNGHPRSLIRLYTDGIEMLKRLDHPNVKIMADTNYFIAGNWPIEDILKAPELLVHTHTAGIKGQPGVGDMTAYHTKMFQVLKSIGYTKTVGIACPWVSTKGGAMDFKYESGKSLKYLQDLRAKVYAG
jgi:sugar phosphate isomerase/epimerase